MQTPSVKPLSHPKKATQAFYQIFTSSPISNRFKKPIFKEKGPSNSCQHFETPNLPEPKEELLVPSPQKKTEECDLKPAAVEGSSEVKGEPHTPATVTTPPSCKSEPLPADNPDEDEEDEDKTVFFTPELFEGDVEEGSPHKETKTESPTRTVLEADSPVLLSEELFHSKQTQGQASMFDGQRAISASEESAELSQGQKEVKGQTQGEEGEQVKAQSRQTSSKLRRLSRSRQKAPPTPTGN